VYVGAGFESAGTVAIGNLMMISTECKVVGADHLYDVVGTPTRLAFASDRRTTIFGADVWIGMRVTIREG
jgi:acetyltransferase-like isoleucine patch superfamily enzyme